jgi:hypothetical protein
LATAAVLVLALVAPWERGRTDIVERARAAIGDAPVLHAVTRETVPTGETLVDLATGKRTHVDYVSEQEIWYDRGRGLAHTVTRTNGVLTDDVLQTPKGGVSMDGPVITCAWIARHPVEATRQRVSCRFDGENGTTPRKVPEQPPSVDPALGGFLTQYREALARGQVRRTGEGEIDGEPVYWLSIPIDVPTDPTAPPGPSIDERELVAVDRSNYRPVLVRTLVNGSVSHSYRVVEIATLGRNGADFTKPAPRPARDRIAIGEVVGHAEIEPAVATEVLGRPALWLGREFDGLKLASVEHQKIRTGYARSTGLLPKTDDAVKLTYTDEQGVRQIVLEESTRPEFGFGWSFVFSVRSGGDLPEGKLSLPGSFGEGFLARDGLHVVIQAWRDPGRVVPAAQALVPIPAGA